MMFGATEDVAERGEVSFEERCPKLKLHLAFLALQFACHKLYASNHDKVNL